MATQETNPTPKKSDERPHISHSQVSMFDNCSLRWYLSYVCKMRKPSTIQMMVGTVVHEALATNFMQKATTGKDLTVDELLDAYSTSFEKNLTDRKCELKAGQIPAFFKDAGVATLTKYMTDIAPPLVPAMMKMPDESGAMVDKPVVELKLTSELPGTGVDFVGVIDMRESGGRVIDYKIVAKKWGKNDEEKKRQAIAYGFLLNEEIDGEFHICVRSADKPLVQVVQTRVTRFEINAYIGHLWDVITAMKLIATSEMEPRLSSGFCNEHLCQHYFECREWQMGILEVEPQPGNWAHLDTDSIEEAA